MTRIVVCIPTYGRGDQFYHRLWTLLRQELPTGVELAAAVSTVQGDVHSWKMAVQLENKWPGRIVMVERGPDTTAVDGWLQAYMAAPGADWYVLGADDVEWHPGWLVEALGIAGLTRAQVIGLNDLSTDLADYAPHYMMSGEYAAKYGFIPPGYRSWWFDREVCQAARMRGKYAPAWKAIAEHVHPDWGKAPLDDTYRNGMPYRDADHHLYERRRAGGFQYAR